LDTTTSRSRREGNAVRILSGTAAAYKTQVIQVDILLILIDHLCHRATAFDSLTTATAAVRVSCIENGLHINTYIIAYLHKTCVEVENVSYFRKPSWSNLIARL